MHNHPSLKPEALLDLATSAQLIPLLLHRGEEALRDGNVAAFPGLHAALRRARETLSIANAGVGQGDVAGMLSATHDLERRMISAADRANK